MTDVRSEAVTGNGRSDDADAPEPAPTTTATTASTTTTAPAAAEPAPAGVAPSTGVLLAALSGAAGAIHLAMVPSHMDEWAAEGIAFVVAGWLQLVFAVAVLLRPARRLLPAGVALNAVFVAAWAITRTAGAPFGPNSGHAESS